MNPFVILFVAIVSEIVATSALKASEGFTRPLPSLLVVAGYGLAFYLMAQILGKLPVGMVYAIWSGLGIVGISLVGLVVFRETLTLAHGIGIGLIVAGVVILQLFAPSSAH